MSTMKVFVTFYARPMTKETFNVTCHPLTFSDVSYWTVSEDVDCYLNDYFFEEFQSKMYEKSIYKFAGILNIEFIKYSSYDGEEWDAKMYMDQTLFLERASDLTELSNALSAAEILDKTRFRTRKKHEPFFLVT